MLSPPFPLPIDGVASEVARALAAGTSAVLVAPPGAGKTTRLPLILLEQSFAARGKIIMLEPRRLAARAAAEWMAARLGESVGETIGLRVRLDARVSAKTRLEIVTEGVFARMIVDDPVLTASRRYCSTNSTNVRSMPILASLWPSMRRRDCARICAFWSCRQRSTARASRD